MKLVKTEIPDVFIIEPRVVEDTRGYFYESYNEDEFITNGISCRFVQDNISKSSYGVIRGLHCQRGEYSQAKLVRVLSGRILDIAVDVRKDSKTFGKYVAVELSEDNYRQIFIPRGFLHGFSVLSETAITAYKVDNYYNRQSEWGMRYDAPEFNIDWKIPADRVITSEKDRIEHSLKDVPEFSL